MNVLFLGIVPDDPLPGLAPLGPAARERLIVLGTMVFVVAAVLFWVLVIRKKPRKRKEHRHHHRRSIGETAVKGVSEIKEIIHERQRRHRRERRQRNPTLAETGGLPPARPDEPSAQSQSPPQT